MIRSLLYVSRRFGTNGDDMDVIDDIGQVSISRNAVLNVRGALVVTGHFFAQRLEGPPDSISTLMSSITRDPRHRDLRIVEDLDQRAARFKDWFLLRMNVSSYVENKIRLLFEAPKPDPHHVAAFGELMRRLTEGRRPGGMTVE